MRSTPRDTPKTLPLSEAARKQWPHYLRARALASQLSDKQIDALPDGPTARHQLSDIQIDACVAAARVFGESHVEKDIPYWTQAQGSKFLRRMRRKLLRGDKMKV